MRTRILAAAIAAVMLLTLAIQPALAVDQYWDTTGATAGVGGAGTWNTTTSNWNNATGNGTPALWGSGNVAIFDGTPGTVTVNTAAPINVGELQFNVSGYTITALGNVAADTLTLQTGTIAVGANSATLNAKLAGTGVTITKTGTGTLTIGGGAVNTFTGTFNVDEGLVELNKSSGGPAMSASMNIGTGLGAANAAIVRYTGTSTNQIGAVPVTVQADGKLDFNGISDLFGSGSSALTLHGTASKSATVTTTAASTASVSLNGLTTFNGGGMLDSGTSTGKTVIVPNNGITYTALAGNNGSMAVIAGNLETNGIHVFNVGNDTSLPVDMRVTAAVNDGLTVTTHSRAMQKSGAGALELAAAGTRSGLTTVNANGGTLIVSANNALGTAVPAAGTATAAGTIVNANGTLAFQGGINYSTAEALTITGIGNTVAGRSGAIDNLSGSNTFVGPITLTNSGAFVNSTIGASTGVLTLTGGINGDIAGRTLTFNGAGDVNVTTLGIGPNVSTLTKTGAGTLLLAATNTYTGATSINAGTLLVDGSITSNVTAASGATLGGSGTITGNVTAPGKVAPGNSPGTLTITGTYNGTGSGANGLFLEVNNTLVVADLLDVGGTATISGLIDIIRLDAGPILTNQTYDLIRADVLSINAGTLSVAQADAAATFAGGGAVATLTVLPNAIGSDDVLRLTLEVPEPTSVTVVMQAAAAGVLRRRRHTHVR